MIPRGRTLWKIKKKDLPLFFLPKKRIKCVFFSPIDTWVKRLPVRRGPVGRGDSMAILTFILGTWTGLFIAALMNVAKRNDLDD